MTWEVDAPNKIKANLGFPIEAAHRHFYDQPAIPSNQMQPYYQNYSVNSETTPYIAGSLRVFLNGIRLSAVHGVYAPGSLVNDAWTLLSYTEDAVGGAFTLSTPVSQEDVVRIDYDILLAPATV